MLECVLHFDKRALYWYTIHMYLEKWPHIPLHSFGSLPRSPAKVVRKFFCSPSLSLSPLFNFRKLKTHVGLRAHRDTQFENRFSTMQAAIAATQFHSLFLFLGCVCVCVCCCFFAHMMQSSMHKTPEMCVCIPIFKLKPSEYSESSTEHREPTLVPFASQMKGNESTEWKKHMQNSLSLSLSW